MEASVDHLSRGPVWMPIPPITGSFFHTVHNSKAKGSTFEAMHDKMTSSAASIWMRERKTNGSSDVNTMVLNAHAHFHQAEVGNNAQLVVRVIQRAQTASSAVSSPSRGGSLRSNTK
jgi:hypothetical protein